MMHLADRYSRWLEEGFIAETPLPRLSRELPQVEFQMLWMAGEFGRDFVTTTGGTVRIESFGEWNAEAGPEFANAIVSFGNARAKGGVAVHTHASRWEEVAVENPEYEGVILHVFTREAAREWGQAVPTTCTALGREVPQIWLDTQRFEYPPSDPPLADGTNCRAILTSFPPERVEELLEAAAQYRMARKASRLARAADHCGRDEALYRAVAEALGYRHNKLPFSLLAQRFSLQRLREERLDIEPLLFAGSGFLNAADFHSLPDDARGYLRKVWTQWWPKRTEYERLAVPAALWNLQSVRPANHPQRRVAALMEIVRHWPILETLARSADPAELHHFFEKLSHPYWDFHYTLTSHACTAPMALVGASRVNDLLINVFFPNALAQAPKFWEAYRRMPADDVNRRVRRITQRLFGTGAVMRRLHRSAMMQQGLLQLGEDFCIACDGDCARCLFPAKLERWE